MTHSLAHTRTYTYTLERAHSVGSCAVPAPTHFPGLFHTNAFAFNEIICH